MGVRAGRRTTTSQLGLRVEGRRLARSEPFESDRQGSGKTARSGALRGGLIEGHTVVRITRMPIVDRSDVRLTGTAATTRQGQSAAPFFRSDERLAERDGGPPNHRRSVDQQPITVRLKPDTTEATDTSLRTESLR
jgi:hypothetical protein